MAAIQAVILIAAAIALIAISRWLRADSGVPDGDIPYVDTGPDSRVLRSDAYGLAGRPDYLVRRDGGIVPLELKTGRGDGRVYRSDILQLACYCLLTEENYADFPGYGLLRAGKVSRQVEFTPELRAALLETLAEMRTLVSAEDVAPNHQNPARCRSCGFRRKCGAPVAPGRGT